jgi:hypothetical protein
MANHTKTTDFAYHLGTENGSSVHAGRGAAPHGGDGVPVFSPATQGEGGVAAGLVLSKTSGNDGQQKTGCHREKDHLDITFNKEETARKRVARLKRNVWFSGRLHGSMSCRRGRRPDVAHFVTLTYVGVNDWQPGHISEALRRYRNYCKRLGVATRYLWVGELQKRGAVHYHLCVWLPHGVRMPKWDNGHISPSGAWCEAFWPHGMTNTQKVKKSAIGYLMKYLQKLNEFHVFPDGMRLYGVGGLESQERAIRGWSNMPEWVKCEHGVGEVRRIGGRLMVADTGELLEPVWRCQCIPGGLRMTLLRDKPQRFHDGPYSAFPCVL